MRGTIQARGKQSWRIRAYVGRDGTGTKRYVSRTVRGTRRDAERGGPRRRGPRPRDLLISSPSLDPARGERPC
jgi:hypothetical protein